MYWKTYKWGAIWSLFILIICSIHGTNLPSSNFLVSIHFDKIVHLILYLILFLLLKNDVHLILNSSFIFPMVYSVSYGVFIEVVQHYFIPGRAADIYDVYADMIGVFIGMIIVIYFKNKPSN